jgi:hypothetical protein
LEHLRARLAGISAEAGELHAHATEAGLPVQPAVTSGVTELRDRSDRVSGDLRAVEVEIQQIFSAPKVVAYLEWRATLAGADD